MLSIVKIYIMKSKSIVITGAGRGIGLALVKWFIKKNHNILAISRNVEALHALAGHKQNLSVLSKDLTIGSDLKSIKEWISQNWNGIDILIHNAGFIVNKPFIETSNAEFEKVYKVNVFAVAELTRLLYPYLVKNSHVLAISSMGGVQGSVKFPGLSAYSSSKGAVITLMELLAEEFKEEQISCNVLALGAVQTEMLAKAFPGYKAPNSPEEIAEFIGDFALNGHRFFNGKLLPVSASTP